MDWSEADCGEILTLLERYLDDEVPREARVPIERHLEGCSGCLERKEFRARLQEIIRGKCRRDELPRGVEARIRQALSRPL